MKKFYCLLLISIVSLNSFSQAILPSFYNFENFSSVDSLPDGWTSNISGNFTYALGQSGLAGKLDITGEFIKIETSESIDTLSFYMKGWIGGGPTAWTGTFKVQESIDTLTWNDLASYTTMNTNAYELFKLAPSNESRFLRFFFDTKILGCNVGIDEVSLTASTILNAIDIKNEELTLFPNPVLGNQLNIRSSKKIASIQLSNLIGQVVYSINNPGMSDLTTSINIDKFPNGIYYVNIVNQDQTNSVKKISIR
jgi:hypothetical protein